MDKWQTQQAFWGSFGIPAYDDQTVFTEGELPAYPHLTYESFGGNIGQETQISVSLWYRTSSWEPITKKADEIHEYLKKHEPVVIKMSGGYMWFKVPIMAPFAQRVSSGDDESIKRILLTVEAESLSAY